LGTKSLTNPKGEVSKLSGKGFGADGRRQSDGKIDISSIKSPNSSRKSIKKLIGNYEISTLY
jgi:hypothetical protein